MGTKSMIDTSGSIMYNMVVVQSVFGIIKAAFRSEQFIYYFMKAEV